MPVEFGRPENIGEAYHYMLLRLKMLNERVICCGTEFHAEQNALARSFGDAVAVWAAQQPTSLEGMRALRTGYVTLNVDFGRAPSYDVRHIAYVAAYPALRERWAEVEASMRPTIAAEVVRTRDTRFVNDLVLEDADTLYYDNIINREYEAAARSAKAAEDRGRVNLYSKVSNGVAQPTTGDILRLSDHYYVASLRPYAKRPNRSPPFKNLAGRGIPHPS